MTSLFGTPEQTPEGDDIRFELEARHIATSGDMDAIERRYLAEGIERDYNGGRRDDNWQDR